MNLILNTQSSLKFTKNGKCRHPQVQQCRFFVYKHNYTGDYKPAYKGYKSEETFEFVPPEEVDYPTKDEFRTLSKHRQLARFNWFIKRTEKYNNQWLQDFLHSDFFKNQILAFHRAEQTYCRLMAFNPIRKKYIEKLAGTRRAIAQRIDRQEFFMGYFKALYFIGLVFHEKLFIEKVLAWRNKNYRRWYKFAIVYWVVRLLKFIFYWLNRLFSRIEKSPLIAKFRKHVDSMTALWAFIIISMVCLSPFFFVSDPWTWFEMQLLIEETLNGQYDLNTFGEYLVRRVEYFKAFHLYYDTDWRFFFWHFGVGLCLPIVAFHFIWMRSIWFCQEGFFDEDRPRYLTKIWAEKEYQTNFEELFAYQFFWIWNAIFLAYWRLFIWGKWQKVYDLVLEKQFSQYYLSYGNWWNYNKATWFLKYFYWVEEQKSRMKQNEDNLLRPWKEDFVIFEPAWNKKTFLFPKVYLSPSWVDQKIFDGRRAIVPKKGSKGWFESKVMANNFDREDSALMIDQASHGLLHNLYYYAERNNVYDNWSIRNMKGSGGMNFYPYRYRFYWWLDDIVPLNKRYYFVPYGWVSPEAYHFKSIIVNYGRQSSFSRDMSMMSDWHQLPICSIISAHSRFRRTCFEYDIPFDYTDWTTEQSLHKAFIDPKSWFYAFRDFDLLEEREYAFGFTDDPFLFAWLIAPPVRRHASLAVHHGDELRPPVVDSFNYLPFIMSPAHAVHDINAENLICHSKEISF